VRSGDLPHPLPEDLVDLIAVQLNILGQPTRIRILDALRSGAKSVQEITDASLTTQQNVSRHLRLLLEAGMVQRRSQGREAIYSLVADPSELWAAALLLIR